MLGLATTFHTVAARGGCHDCTLLCGFFFSIRATVTPHLCHVLIDMGQASSTSASGGALLNCRLFCCKPKPPKATTTNHNNDDHNNYINYDRRSPPESKEKETEKESKVADMANLNFNPIVLDDDEDEDREVIPIDDDDDDAVVDPVERPNPKVLADNCKDGVKAVFPDICPDYVEKLAAEYHYNLDVTIGVILDRQENGQKYPVRSLLERKRKYGDYENDNDDDDEDEDPGQRVIKAMKAKVAKPGYPGKLSAKEYENIAKYMIAIEVRMDNISRSRHFGI